MDCPECKNKMQHIHLYQHTWEQEAEEAREHLYRETEGTTELMACDWRCQECGEMSEGPCAV